MANSKSYKLRKNRPHPLIRETVKPALRAAEFFAGIGLVRKAMELNDVSVVFANDIDRDKLDIYQKNFYAGDFLLRDIRAISGADVPLVDIATASFPCTDLSLAGKRAGLEGDQSGMFWEFSRIINEMGVRKPRVVLIENVIGFATSNSGKDLELAIRRLNSLGYWCDLFILDAKWFIPQSRPRLFIAGISEKLSRDDGYQPNELRPDWLRKFILTRPDLKTNSFPLQLPSRNGRKSLDALLERFDANHSIWWDKEKTSAVKSSLSPLQLRRLELMIQRPKITRATAYRRTRLGKAVWEVRADDLSGCLRTARGGSSKQAVVEAGNSRFRVRWMTAREYAALQGVEDFFIEGVRESKALFGFGDAVCVPAISWIIKNYLLHVLDNDASASNIIGVANESKNEALVAHGA